MGDLRLERALQGLREGKISPQEYDSYVTYLEKQNLEKQNLEKQKSSEISSEFMKSIEPKAEPAPIQRELSEKTIIKQNKTLDRPRKSYVKPIVALLIFILIANVVWIIYNTSNISGNVIFDIYQQNQNGDNSSNMTMHSSQELTSIQVTGTMYGEGTAIISYNTKNGSLHVATINSDTGIPRTSKSSYAPEDSITLDHEPTNYNAYIDDGTNTIPVTLPLQAPENNATLLLVVNDSNNLTTYKLPIIIGNAERKTTFTNLCDETCQMSPATGNLIVETTGEARVVFDSIDATAKQNSAPIYAIQINALTINDTTTIDLNSHFADSDSNTIYYSTSNSTIADLKINNSILTITPITNGQDTITVYASDLKDLTPGTFELTVSGIVTKETNTTPNTTTEISNVLNDTNNDNISTNITENITANITDNNISINTSDNITNITLNNTENNNVTNETITSRVDCSNPDPNARPIECIQNENSTYFRPEDIMIENKQGATVGQLTPVGNLLIKGGLVEHSTGSPSSSDYQLGYTNDVGDFVSTMWIDTATGNLNLKGTLTEANGNIPLQEGWTSFVNRRGIILALYNPTTGSMMVRGNIIPYRAKI